MVKSNVYRQFLAAVGIEKLLEKAAIYYLRYFYCKMLAEYGREVRFERARLMRKSPLDYRRVRELDMTLDEVTVQLREIELEQSLYN